MQLPLSLTSATGHWPVLGRPCAVALEMVTLLAVCLLGLSTSGCQESSNAGPLQLAPVSGRIELDGEPVGEVKVTLLPTQLFQPGKRIFPVAAGLTDASGRFELGTDGAPGVVAGEYWVLLSKREENAGDMSPSELMEPPPNAPPAAVELARKLANLDIEGELELSGQTDVFPAFYNAETRLRLTVPPEGTQEANFNLSIFDLPLIPKER